MGFLCCAPPTLTVAQSVQIAMLDAWLDELSGIVTRAAAGEPNYRVLSRLWADKTTPPKIPELDPDELHDPLRRAA